MPSIGAVSQYAVSDGPAIEFSAPSLKAIAEALVADPILFLEITAREGTATEYIDTVGAVSCLPVSALQLARSQRATKTFLFSSRPWTGAPDDTFRANIRAIPSLLTAGTISRSVPVESSVIKRGQRTIGDAQIVNADGSADSMLKDYTVDNENIAAYIAQPGDDSANWALAYGATIASVQATRLVIQLSISTVADQLDRSVQLSKYTGAGGIRGDSSVAGKLKPTCWGECWGVDPVLISAADWIYQVHDRSIQSVDWVREGGLDYTATSDYDTFDDLAAAALDIGEFATCLALGLFRIGVASSGLTFPLRAGIKGDNSSPGYVSSTGDILYRIARQRAFISADQVDASSFNALPRARIGYYTNGASDVAVSSIFDALLRGVNAAYGVGREDVVSILRLRPAEYSLNDLSLNSNEIMDDRLEARPYVPRTNQPYSYAPTFAPVADNEVSDAADATVAARLVNGALYGEVDEVSEITAALVPQPRLPTYFADQAPAIQSAQAALQFATQNTLPLRLYLGRLGMLSNLGSVIGISGETRFTSDFRGIVYQQEDDLGASPSSQAVALG